MAHLMRIIKVIHFAGAPHWRGTVHHWLGMAPQWSGMVQTVRHGTVHHWLGILGFLQEVRTRAGN